MPVNCARAVLIVGMVTLFADSCSSGGENAPAPTSPTLSETSLAGNRGRTLQHRGSSIEIDALNESGMDFLGWALDRDVFAYVVHDGEHPAIHNTVYFSVPEGRERCQLKGPVEISPRIGRPQPFQWLPNGIVIATTTTGVAYSGRPCDDEGFVLDNRDPGTCELRTKQLSPLGTLTAITEQVSSRDGVVSMESSIMDSATKELKARIDWAMPEMMNSVCNPRFFTDWIGESRYLIGRSSVPGPLILSATGEVLPLVEQAWARQVVGDSPEWLSVSGVAVGPSGDYALLLRSLRSQLAIIYRSKEDSTEDISLGAGIAAFSPNGRWLAIGNKADASDRSPIELIATDRGADDSIMSSRGIGEVEGLAWSPTSEMIAIDTDDATFDGAHVLKVDPVNRLLVETDSFGRSGSIGTNTWSPSGRIFQVRDLDSDVTHFYAVERR